VDSRLRGNDIRGHGSDGKEILVFPHDMRFLQKLVVWSRE
jgi:hypothetical protein